VKKFSKKWSSDYNKKAQGWQFNISIELISFDFSFNKYEEFWCSLSLFIISNNLLSDL